MAQIKAGTTTPLSYDLVFDTTTDFIWFPMTPCGSICDENIDDANPWLDYVPATYGGTEGVAQSLTYTSGDILTGN